MILYDMTKLLSKAIDRTPTGIERIDYQYSRHFTRYHGNSVVFVSQRRGRMYIVGTKTAMEIIGALGKRWDMELATAEKRYAYHSAEAADYLNDDMRKRGRFADEFLRSLAKASRSQSPDRYMLAGSISERVRQAHEIECLVLGHLGWYPIKSLPTFVRSVVLIFVCSLPYKLMSHLNNCIHELVGAGLAVAKWLRIVVGVDSPPAAHRLSIALTKLLTTGPAAACTYVNISQAGLRHTNLFAQLQDTRTLNLVFFLHDFLPIEFPEFFKKGNFRAHQQRLEVVFEFGTHFVMNSKYTHRAMVKYTSEMNIRTNATKNAVVIHPGVDAIFLKENRIDNHILFDTRSFFLIIGTIEPRKNHILLLTIWHSLAKDGAGEVPNLVIAGRRGWENENVANRLDRCREIGNYIFELPGIDDRILSNLLRQSCALLCPSFAEGWGMPVAEALAMGTPVICSDIPAFRESGQGIPEYLDPTDGLAWKEMILKYAVPGSSERQVQLHRLANFKAPTWKEHFSRLERFVGLPGQ